MIFGSFKHHLFYIENDSVRKNRVTISFHKYIYILILKAFLLFNIFWEFLALERIVCRSFEKSCEIAFIIFEDIITVFGNFFCVLMKREVFLDHFKLLFLLFAFRCLNLRSFLDKLNAILGVLLRRFYYFGKVLL